MSEIEELMALQIRALKLPAPVREFKFNPYREWMFDFAWPNSKAAVEVEGMVHRIKARFESDIEKYAIAQLSGWTVLRVSGKTIRSGAAVKWVEELLEMHA